MIEGIFGRINSGQVIGWAYDTDDPKPVRIKVKCKGKVIVTGVADIQRSDLVEVSPLHKGKIGYKIQLPKGPKLWHKIELFANGQQIAKAPHLQMKIEKSRRSLTLEMDKPHFFIHIPKTAGTAFKKLLEEKHLGGRFFPSRAYVDKNGGLYPHLPELIKLDQPRKTPSILIGHYPYATQQMVKGVPKKIVILRDPVERVISNIYHIKNYDTRMEGKTPEEVYKLGSWHFSNLQVRYLTDKGIHPNMRFLDGKPLKQPQLKSAVANMRSCEVVGISKQLDRTVDLANKALGWSLSTPKQVNVARTPKVISDKLRKRIIADNQLDQKLFDMATQRFNNLCAEYEV